LRYLQTKRDRMGHDLPEDLPGDEPAPQAPAAETEA
jgi:hypothetical protein